MFGICSDIVASSLIPSDKVFKIKYFKISFDINNSLIRVRWKNEGNKELPNNNSFFYVIILDLLISEKASVTFDPFLYDLLTYKRNWVCSISQIHSDCIWTFYMLVCNIDLLIFHFLNSVIKFYFYISGYVNLIWTVMWYFLELNYWVKRFGFLQNICHSFVKITLTVFTKIGTLKFPSLFKNDFKF